MEKKIVLRGLLCWASNGENDRLLGLLGNTHEVLIVAQELADEISGESVSVRYFTSTSPLSEDQLEIELANIASGIAEADYGMHYSEITGYLWTDEYLIIGGHNLIEELESSLGKYLHLEIIIHSKEA